MDQRQVRAGQEYPRLTRMKRCLPLLLLALVLLALAAQAQAEDGDGEDVTPRETNASISFAALQHVAGTSALSTFSPTPVLKIAPNGRMMIGYNQVMPGGIQNPYYSVFNRTTGSWSTPQPIRTSSNHLRYGTFAFDNNNRGHAVWLDGNGVYYAAESGWPGASRKISSGGDMILDPPAITIGPDGVIHVVWSQGPNQFAVYHAYSRNGGTDWTISPALTSPADDANAVAVAATAEGSVHVAWEKPTPDVPSYRYEIFYRKGTPQGTGYSWGSPLKLSLTLTNALRPTLVAEGNRLHLGFSRSNDSGSEQYAYYRRFASGSWGPLVNVNLGRPVSVNTSNPYYLTTSLAVCGGATHLFFHGAPHGAVSEQVWGASSSDDWQGLSAITPLGQRYIHPTVACYNSNLALGVDRVAAGTVHDIYSGIEQKRVLLPLIRKSSN